MRVRVLKSYVLSALLFVDLDSAGGHRLRWHVLVGRLRIWRQETWLCGRKHTKRRLGCCLSRALLLDGRLFLRKITYLHVDLMTLCRTVQGLRRFQSRKDRLLYRLSNDLLLLDDWLDVLGRRRGSLEPLISLRLLLCLGSWHRFLISPLTLTVFQIVDLGHDPCLHPLVQQIGCDSAHYPRRLLCANNRGLLLLLGS